MVRCNLCVSGGASPFYTGSGNQYEDAVLPSGMAIGEPHEALDCACGLYLSDPSAGYELRRGPLARTSQ
jgi:hypothetical protein